MKCGDHSLGGDAGEGGGRVHHDSGTYASYLRGVIF